MPQTALQQLQINVILLQVYSFKVYIHPFHEVAVHNYPVIVFLISNIPFYITPCNNLPSSGTLMPIISG